mmetsp:Transcript_2646/g.6197  ORF Transcript_2646/g.6197 Transcript_2646/m.6197 type:complete len:176 (+) Transcript_2646:182-709(+)|eukprot:CAMPEP_0171497394 /NCGR_PEP_ID=MMETSP0958-20121227/7254_1 /TAXON_ID=87120 /ORGANISM="Aurantiochytrium limacinum, Strain ATCCMYA-1381" /LENGTH=175 /DNA_ID=CAMNT_0012031645 /DNA_START=189 /DNA_END=716 /DNA_ORIENTATION=+
MMMNLMRAPAAALRRSARGLHASSALRMAEAEPTTDGASLTLTFASATRPVVKKEPVFLVNVPGMTGEFGVAAEHSPVVSELKPGLVQITRKEGDAPESYFVTGGLAAVHEDSTMDVAAAEIASLDELDGAVAQKLYAEAKRTADAAAEGSKEQAIAQVQAETYEAVCIALGVSI